MAGIALELVLLLALIVANGLLAMSEIAIVSAPKARLRHRADQGDERAAAALELATHPNRFLSTVQVGITLVGILAGAVGGARIAEVLSAFLGNAGVAAGYRDAAALAFVVVAITFLNVVLGELVPKRIALDSAADISARVAGPVTLLARLGAPVVSLLTGTTDFVLRVLGRRRRPVTGITEQELVAMLAHATEKGVIERGEQQIVERLFRLSDHTVSEIMTPRERVVYLDLEDGVESAMQRIKAEAHPRYPVCRGGLDHTMGFVTVHDLLQRKLEGAPLLDLGVVQDPHWVGLEFPALRLLHIFQVSGVHLAMVRDASERVQGIVTVTDLLERVVGELPDVGEFGRRAIVQREDGSWLVDASVTIAELCRALPVARDRIPDCSPDTTVADVIKPYLKGEIGPTAAFELDGLRFEVVDMDGARIDKVLISNWNQGNRT